jgi:TonB dependent receptor.
VGLRYDIRPDLQVYGNLSRSVEPPHPWSLVWSAPVNNQPMKMQNQTATTLETGRPRRLGAGALGPGLVLLAGAS